MIGKKSIMIIEDHESIRLLLGRFLSKNYNVCTKKDGLEGLAWLRTGNMPDLIILDLDMPRLPGLEFLTNIRSSGFYRNIPVVIVSGEDVSRYKEQIEKLGISGFIPKPFDPIELNNIIEKVLNANGQLVASN